MGMELLGHSQTGILESQIMLGVMSIVWLGRMDFGSGMMSVAETTESDLFAKSLIDNHDDSCSFLLTYLLSQPLCSDLTKMLIITQYLLSLASFYWNINTKLT